MRATSKYEQLDQAEANVLGILALYCEVLEDIRGGELASGLQ